MTVQPVRRTEGIPSFVEIVRVHAVYVYRPGRWTCEACDFVGELAEALWHVVAEQWDQTGWSR